MKHILISIRMLLFMTVLTGVIYPFVVSAIGLGLFPHAASGSLLNRSGLQVGSSLVSQSFENEKYFWSRPSAVGHNPLPSGGSNLGQGSADLKKAFGERLARLKAAHPGMGEPPQDLLFASGSGLDPHISPEAAMYQIHRVAKARGLTSEVIAAIVSQNIEGRQFGVLGDPRVNVLQLNLALDESQGIVAAPTPVPSASPSPEVGKGNGD